MSVGLNTFPSTHSAPLRSHQSIPQSPKGQPTLISNQILSNQEDFQQARSPVSELPKDYYEEKSKREKRKASPPCEGCTKWAQWAAQQQLLLLGLESDLIGKQASIAQSVQSANLQLSQQSERIKQLVTAEARLQEEVAKLQNELANIKLKEEERTKNNSSTFRPYQSHLVEGSPQEYQPKLGKISACTGKTKSDNRANTFTSSLSGASQQRNCLDREVKHPLISQPIEKGEVGRQHFENENLRAYNEVLLKQLKGRRLRFPF